MDVDKDVMRAGPWPELHPLKAEAVAKLKQKGNELHQLMEEVAELDGNVPNGIDPRCMALGKTNLEQAIMWAVKGVTA